MGRPLRLHADLHLVPGADRRRADRLAVDSCQDHDVASLSLRLSANSTVPAKPRSSNSSPPSSAMASSVASLASQIAVRSTVFERARVRRLVGRGQLLHGTMKVPRNLTVAFPSHQTHDASPDPPRHRLAGQAPADADEDDLALRFDVGQCPASLVLVPPRFTPAVPLDLRHGSPPWCEDTGAAFPPHKRPGGVETSRPFPHAAARRPISSTSSVRVSSCDFAVASNTGAHSSGLPLADRFAPSQRHVEPVERMVLEHLADPAHLFEVAGVQPDRPLGDRVAAVPLQHPVDVRVAQEAATDIAADRLVIGRVVEHVHAAVIEAPAP